MTKEEFLSGAPFVLAGLPTSNYFYTYVDIAGGYIVEHRGGERVGHHCNVEAITEKGVKLYSCILDKPVRVRYPFSKLILKQ